MPTCPRTALRVEVHVDQFGHVVRPGVRRSSLAGDRLDAHLQREVGDDRREVAVAGALTDPVDRALHLGGAAPHAGEGVGDSNTWCCCLPGPRRYVLLLTAMLDVGGLSSQQRAVFRAVDILLTAGLLSGGTSGISAITELLGTYANVLRKDALKKP